MPRKPTKHGKLTVQQHASELGVPKTTILDWIKSGMPAAEPDRSQWVEAHKATAKNRPKGDSFPAGSPGAQLLLAKHAEDLKFRRLKSKLLELQIKEREGVLIHVDEVAAENAKIHAVIFQRFVGLARAISPRLLHLDDPTLAERIVQDAIDDTLASLAQDGSDERPRQIPPEDPERLPPAGPA
jgi:hypothetical protein